MKVIDLRSDTVTLPTPAMREAMSTAELGDDVFGEDPTVNKLEAMAAERMGKEAAVFTASGTMSNLVAALTHCARGEELILGSESHMYNNEVGSYSAVGGIHVRVVPNDSRGMINPQDVENAIRGKNIHFPQTALICVENTHNQCSGAVLTPEDMRAIAEVAEHHGIPIHLDGARIFNASVYLGIDPKELTRYSTSVCFCLSKGLSCPVGSLLCGPRDFVERARKNRKVLGGGMRQVGVLAAAGIVALETMIDRLAEDHENARYLAQGICQAPGILLDPSRIQTNIVISQVTQGTPQEFVQRLNAMGIKANYRGGNKVRMVTHYGIVREDIDLVIDAVNEVMHHPKAVYPI